MPWVSQEPKKLEPLQSSITKTFFFKLVHSLRENGPSPSPAGKRVSHKLCQMLPGSCFPTLPPAFPAFGDEIISFGANYRWRMLGMYRETSSEPSPPIITGCTMPGRAGTGGWMSGLKFSLGAGEGHAFLSHSVDLLSWNAEP